MKKTDAWYPAATVAPPAEWSTIGERGHAVQFYSTEGQLLDRLTWFIGGALTAGDIGVVVATRKHREALARRLEARGFDLSIACKQARYIALDAPATLATLTRDGQLDATLFREVIAGMMHELVGRSGGRRIAAAGEMVALLWAQGKGDSAIRLEALWNDLAQEYAFSLFCAYPMSGFCSKDVAPFMQICAQHSHVFTLA